MKTFKPELIPHTFKAFKNKDTNERIFSPMFIKSSHAALSHHSNKAFIYNGQIGFVYPHYKSFNHNIPMTHDQLKLWETRPLTSQRT